MALNVTTTSVALHVHRTGHLFNPSWPLIIKVKLIHACILNNNGRFNTLLCAVWRHILLLHCMKTRVYIQALGAFRLAVIYIHYIKWTCNSEAVYVCIYGRFISIAFSRLIRKTVWSVWNTNYLISRFNSYRPTTAHTVPEPEVVLTAFLKNDLLCKKWYMISDKGVTTI